MVILSFLLGAWNTQLEWGPYYTPVTNAQPMAASLCFIISISILDIFLKASLYPGFPNRICICQWAQNPSCSSSETQEYLLFFQCSHEDHPCSKHLSAAPLPPLHSSLLTPTHLCGLQMHLLHPPPPCHMFHLFPVSSRHCVFPSQEIWDLYKPPLLESSFCFCTQACCISPTCHRCTCLLSFPAQTWQLSTICSLSSAVLRALVHLLPHTLPGWVILFHCKHPPVFLALGLEQVTSLALEEQEMFLFVPGWCHMTLF